MSFFVFLNIKSLEFAGIAYGHRERWYLAVGSAQSAEKCWGQKIWAKREPPSVELWLNFLPLTILPTKERLSLNISSYI